MDIAYNFLIDVENQRHRYIQIGFDNEDGAFSGLIIDYVGGGEYGSFYALNDGILCELEEYEDCDDDAFEEMLEKAQPGIMKSINEIMDRYVGWDDKTNTYTFTQAFIDECDPATMTDDIIFGTNTTGPFEVALTDFSKFA